MSANTKIEWANHSWSPWIGCTKVSPGCAKCYAASYDKRVGGDHWGKGKPRRRTSANYWKQPLKWNATPWICDQCGPVENRHCGRHASHRARVFPSLCDPFDAEVPVEWLADFLQLIHDTPNLDWLLLTKRPELFTDRICAVFELTGQDAEHFDRWTGAHIIAEGWISEGNATRMPDNVWLGVSVEDQIRADERIPILLRLPAVVRFLSIEPLIGPVNLAIWLHEREGFDWAIIGGESGPGARPCDVHWIRSVAAQCKAAGVATFVKQLGANIIDRNDVGFDGETPREWPMDTDTRDIDTGYQGAPLRVLLRDRKGGDLNEWPENLRIREFPNVERITS